MAATATGIRYLRGGRESTAKADTVVLAASALFNPYIMLRSGMSHPLLGKRLHEQYALSVYLDLAGVKAYNGSSVITANGYNFYDGAHRRDYAACMIEGWTTPFPYHAGALRSAEGRWNERTVIRFLFDDLPQDMNTVTVNKANPALAEVTFRDYSQYAYRGAARIPQMVDKLSEALPIERIFRIEEASTSGHIQGTVVMGHDPATSIVDGYLVHHQLRNLLVLGASAFPTATPILPTLTLSALSLRAADHYLGKGSADLMKRRHFLYLLSGLTSLGTGTLVWRYRHFTDRAAIESIVLRRLSYLKLDPAGVRRFAAAAAATHAISDKKLRALAAAEPIATNFPLPKDSSLARDIAYGEERLVTNYLLSSDFFKTGADVNRLVRYVAYYDPIRACGNPFARLMAAA